MEILLTNPALKAVIADVAEVAGYIWTKGWGERNGGNITVDSVKDEFTQFTITLPTKTE